MTSLLTVENLQYTFRHKRGVFSKTREFTLGPVSFDVQQGETLAIIGNNGSGKSLLAKSLAGAISVDAGTIKVNGVEHSTASVSDIRMILQHSANNLNPNLSIGRILTEPLRLNTGLTAKQIREKVEATLVRVGLLGEHYHFYRHMLSDGQQQRVSLARALILDPKIIVADEPFAALDPSVRSQTVNLILRLQQELGVGFVFISHNIGIVRHISDKVLVMENGKIVEQGPTHDVFSNPQHALTQKLVQSHFNLVENHFSQV